MPAEHLTINFFFYFYAAGRFGKFGATVPFYLILLVAFICTVV